MRESGKQERGLGGNWAQSEGPHLIPWGSSGVSRTSKLPHSRVLGVRTPSQESHRSRAATVRVPVALRDYG